MNNLHLFHEFKKEYSSMPLIIADLSHHNTPTDFALAKANGVVGIIHKATEGLTNIDHTYDSRRILAQRAGLLWGAYHFFRPSDPIKQVSAFLDVAKPDHNTLLCLDHEDERCSAADAITFMKELERRTGRRPILYSGHVIKAQLGNQIEPYLHSCRLWLAEYNPTPVIPPCWDSYFLWQFTGDGKGSPPHFISGLGMDIDLSYFNGTFAELSAIWIGDGRATPPSPYLATGVDRTRWLQASLNLFGANLIVDGKAGERTYAAVSKFQKESGLVNVNGVPNYDTLDALLGKLGLWLETTYGKAPDA